MRVGWNLISKIKSSGPFHLGDAFQGEYRRLKYEHIVSPLHSENEKMLLIPSSENAHPI